LEVTNKGGRSLKSQQEGGRDKETTNISKIRKKQRREPCQHLIDQHAREIKDKRDYNATRETKIGSKRNREEREDRRERK